MEALARALPAWGLPDTLVQESEGRLRRQQKLVGTIVGLMFPSLCGCRTPEELRRGRGGEKHLPSPMLGALPKRSWLQRLRRLGLEVSGPLWQHVQDQSPATRRRWQWTWGVDDAVVTKDGQQLGLVGTWWSGQAKRVRPGIDGGLLLVVIGEGPLVVPVDVAIRRPAPTGPGGPCRDTRRWVQTMRDARWAAGQPRGLALPPPLVGADSWVSDSQWRPQVSRTHHGPLLVEGKAS
jgi:hypothetical protein